MNGKAKRRKLFEEQLSFCEQPIHQHTTNNHAQLLTTMLNHAQPGKRSAVLWPSDLLGKLTYPPAS